MAMRTFRQLRKVAATTILVILLCDVGLMLPACTNSGVAGDPDNSNTSQEEEFSELVSLENGGAYFSPVDNNVFGLDLTALESSMKSLTSETIYLNGVGWFSLMFKPTGEIDIIRAKLIAENNRQSDPQFYDIWNLSETTADFEHRQVSELEAYSGNHDEIKGYFLLKEYDAFFGGQLSPSDEEKYFVPFSDVRMWLRGTSLESIVKEYGDGEAVCYELALQLQKSTNMEEMTGLPYIYIDGSGENPVLMDEAMVEDALIPAQDDSTGHELQFKERDYLVLFEYHNYESGMNDYKIRMVVDDVSSGSIAVTKAIVILI